MLLATNKPYIPIFSRPYTTRTTHLTKLYSAGVRCPCSLRFHAGQYTAPPSHTVVNTFWACQSRSQIPNQSCGSSVLHVQLLLIFQSHLSCSPAQTSKQWSDLPMYELSQSSHVTSYTTPHTPHVPSGRLQSCPSVVGMCTTSAMHCYVPARYQVV